MYFFIHACKNVHADINTYSSVNLNNSRIRFEPKMPWRNTHSVSASTQKGCTVVSRMIWSRHRFAVMLQGCFTL